MISALWFVAGAATCVAVGTAVAYVRTVVRERHQEAQAEEFRRRLRELDESHDLCLVDDANVVPLPARKPDTREWSR